MPPIHRAGKTWNWCATKLSSRTRRRARTSFIRKDENGNPIKLGWLTLPSFYADMDKHQKSTTRDVLALLKRLKKENIAGLVVDLRT
jgi:C-terminal processing protease CtpA/Prc